MTIRVAINGYGRIGRNILRAHYEGGKKHDVQIVAINDLGDAKINAHLTKYDTAHGKFPGTVAVDGDFLVINGDRKAMESSPQFTTNFPDTRKDLFAYDLLVIGGAGKPANASTVAESETRGGEAMSAKVKRPTNSDDGRPPAAPSV